MGSKNITGPGLSAGKNTGRCQVGLAYVVILVLLVLLSVMGLTFVNTISIRSAATYSRLGGIQADYLAQSAAAHARWLLLNDTDFPAASDKYYMHSLGSGRYGYKVRRHTTTTFATVATVGAMAENEAKQSYVIYIMPDASNTLLFVVDKASALTGQDNDRIALFESWGWTVTPITSKSSQGDFDLDLADSGVVYVSCSSNDKKFKEQLLGTSVGVVNALKNQVKKLDLAGGETNISGTDISIVDNTHYITAPFSLGNLTIFTSGMEMVKLNSPAAGGQVLAEISPEDSLMVVESGDELDGGGSASGRRVQLPWGGDNNIDINALTADGQEILKRSLEWASGN